MAKTKIRYFNLNRLKSALKEAKERKDEKEIDVIKTLIETEKKARNKF